MIKKTIFLMMFALPLAAQIPSPQIPLYGTLGNQGSPLLNNGTLIMATDANRTMTAQETSATGGIKVTSSVPLTATRNLVIPAGNFQFLAIENATTGGQAIQVIGPTGTGVTIPNNSSATIWFDGINMVQTGGGGGSYLPLTGGTLTGNIGEVSQSMTATDANNISVPTTTIYTHIFDQSTFALPPVTTGLGSQSQDYRTLKAYGPGLNLGSFDGGGGRVVSQFELAGTFAERGISQMFGASGTKHATGDFNTYNYLYSDGGANGAADEGIGLGNFSGGETNGYFHGTIASTTGTGDTAPVLSFTSGNNWTTDGAFLLDITKGTVSGNYAGVSTPFGSTYLFQIPVSNTLPLSTAWGTLTSVIPNPAVTPNNSVTNTYTVTLGAIGGNSPSFTAGKVCIAGPNYPEQAILNNPGTASGGTQTITLTYHNPNGSGSQYPVIFQGGVCGQYISQDQDLAYSSSTERTSYYAFGAITTGNLIYGVNSHGSVTSQALPFASGAQTTTGGYHLYPGAEIVENTSTGATPVLEPNSVAWAASDVVENPHYTVINTTALKLDITQNTPANNTNSTVGTFYARGFGVAGVNYFGFRLINAQPCSQYSDCSGASNYPQSPFAAYNVSGYWASPFHSDYGPSSLGSMMDIGGTFKGDTSPFLLAQLRNGTGAGPIIGYNPALGATYVPKLQITGIGGSTQCLQASSTGVVSGTGAACGSGGGGGSVTSVGAGSGSSAGVTVSVVNPTTTPAISVVTAPFGASGSSHAQGAVPDPGSTAGTTRFLREDGTWKVNTSAVSLPIENYGAVGDATTIFDGAMAAGSAQYGGGTTVTGTTTGTTYGITTTASNDVVLTLFSMYSRSLSAVPSGLTQRAAIAGSATYPGTFVGDQTVASAGSYGAVTGTFTAATHWLSGTIALVPTSGNSVSFVNATTATASTTSVSVNVPSGVTAGDYLITCGTFYVSAGVSVVTPPAAFTSSVFYVADQLFTPSFESSYGGSVFQCWAKVASGSEPASYAWTQTSTFGAGLVMLDYRNVQSLDTISSASNILTSPSGGFATASVGKLICAYPAGGSNAQQCGTITAVASPTQVTTSFSSRNSFTNGWVSYGTDNSSAFTTALTTAPCSTTGCSLAVGPYQYALQSALVIPPNTAIQINGTGPGVPQNSIAYINANTLPQFNGGSKLLWLTQGLSTAGITIGGTLHVTGSTALAGVNNLAMWGGAGVGGDGGGEDGLDILDMENVRTDNVWVFNFAGRGYYVDALCCTTTPDYRDYIQTISAYQIYTEFNGGNGYQIGSTTMNNVGNVETIKCDTCVSEANYGYGVDIASNALQGFTWMNGTIQWNRRRFSTGTEWNFESTAKVVGCGVLNNYNETDATLGSPGKGFVNNASGATGCHFQNNFILPARGYATRPVFSAAGAPLASCPSNATQTTGNYFAFGVTAPVTDAFGCSAGQPYYTAGSAYPILSQQNTIQPTAPQVFTTVPSTIVTVMVPLAAWLQTPTVGTNRINLGYSASTYGMWVSDQTVSTLGLVPPVQAFYSTAANSVTATIALNATSGSPSFVGASSAQATSANNVTVNLPTGTANGNYIVACAAYYDGSVITAPTGFTSILKVNDINFLPYGTSGGDNLQCYYKIAASEPSTYSWTESTTNGFSVSMLSYSNVNSIGSNKITGGNSCNVRCGADGWIETGSTVDTQ